MQFAELVSAQFSAQGTLLIKVISMETIGK